MWAQICQVLQLNAGLDTGAAERVARQLVAVVRREQDGSLPTWAPGDELPDPPPRWVSDIDGAVWEHQDAGYGCYRMAETDQVAYADSTADTEGVRPWPYLLESEGPLTESQ
jgi:hypothetical protein